MGAKIMYASTLLDFAEVTHSSMSMLGLKMIPSSEKWSLQRQRMH